MGRACPVRGRARWRLLVAFAVLVMSATGLAISASLASAVVGLSLFGNLDSMECTGLSRGQDSNLRHTV
jgi:hypothetical protein